jgi:hypothetical protein
MDEIHYFVLCSHARICLVKNFAILILVERNTIRSVAIPIFRASHNGYGRYLVLITGLLVDLLLLPIHLQEGYC